VRVVVADDSVLYRQGLVRLLEGSGIEVAAQVGDADQLIEAVGHLEPDLAVVDIRMPATPHERRTARRSTSAHTTPESAYSCCPPRRVDARGWAAGENTGGVGYPV
jgi:DNA-binding NarL/FixJ family response regulator